jgi:hypothetical protein
LRAALAEPVQMKLLKKYAEIIEQSWSMPIGNKVVEFKSQISNKLKRRHPRGDYRLLASLKLLLSDIMKQIKKCAATIECL